MKQTKQQKETKIVEKYPKMTKKKIFLILLVICIVQGIVCLYFGFQKEYFHMDEMYSYGLMNAEVIDITQREDFLNNWHTSEYYKGYLEVNKDEVWDFTPVWENQVNDVHPPLYYLLLRIFASFSVDHFTKWTGLALNLVILLVSNFLVYLIGKKLTKSDIYGLLICGINSLTLIVLDSFLYIRMYALCNLLILLVIWVHLKLYEKPDLTAKDLVLLISSLILGGLTHYYFFIFALGIYIVFTIKKIQEKNWKCLAKYQLGVIIAGLMYLIIFPYSIDHILFGQRGLGSIEWNTIFSHIFSYLGLVSKYFFNYTCGALLLVLALLALKNRKKEIGKTGLVFLGFPVFFYLALVFIQTPYVEIRYIIPIASCFNIWLIVCLKNGIEASWGAKKALWITASCFVILVLSPILTKTVPSFTYTQQNQIANRIEEANIPIVYLWNPENNRFLDDLYLFTLAENSLIIDARQDTKEIQDLLSTAPEEYFLIYNEGIEEEKLKDCIPENNEYVQHMNACDIILVH